MGRERESKREGAEGKERVGKREGVDLDICPGAPSS